ncbi:hypothetical protein [Tenacibaculum aiptasiae]|uniref:hypothetical protein n=1 Tax=Tenacibaculum aiptasiae TaxID=426481 RepID=UPI00232E98F1|nr:hypothetical protein [Tenacibaculum aiptasiae]
MELSKKNIALITISILIILIFIFFTGSITNCADEDEAYTSYFSFKKEHNDNDYQALYFSQSKGIFYGIYGKAKIDYDKMSLTGIYLKAINYRRTLPFMQKIGFKSNTLIDTLLYKKSLLYKDGDTLKFDLVLDNFMGSKENVFFELKKPISIENLKNFKIKRYFSYKDIGRKVKNPCKGKKAVGLNCVESELIPIY